MQVDNDMVKILIYLLQYVALNNEFQFLDYHKYKHIFFELQQTLFHCGATLIGELFK